MSGMTDGLLGSAQYASLRRCPAFAAVPVATPPRQHGVYGSEQFDGARAQVLLGDRNVVDRGVNVW